MQGEAKAEVADREKSQSQLGKDKGTKAKDRDREEIARAERLKADRLWQHYQGTDSSPITDLFGGQLQSSIICQKCNSRSTTCVLPPCCPPARCTLFQGHSGVLFLSLTMRGGASYAGPACHSTSEPIAQTWNQR